VEGLLDGHGNPLPTGHFAAWAAAKFHGRGGNDFPLGRLSSMGLAFAVKIR
jgi:hypothetical protein